MNKRILFVVHRYVPYPGGSEYYVRDMAEECKKRGHDVCVLAHEHMGDRNGIRVSNDYSTILNERWNLIVVHGGDVISQNIVHMNAFQINRVSPVAYMLIKPSNSLVCLNGLKHHRFITYSTSADIEHIKNHEVLNKARKIRHGIVPEHTIKNKITKDKKIFVSAGGFYPHKAMLPLAKAFSDTNLDAELHLYGYGEGQIPQETDRIKVFFGKNKDDVLSAIASADAYIMNSYEEGFGLVLLEAMFNKTPWFARNIAGAKDMAQYGNIYNDETELMNMLSNYKPIDKTTENAYNYAMSNHTITDTVVDIENILLELS
jgi:glycosyltransferase involved in cell wall biosynthesis